MEDTEIQKETVARPSWPCNHGLEARDTIAFGSNCIRLSGGEWILAGVIILAIFCLWPVFWESIEEFEHGQDYRIPYELSSDYWLYERYCGSELSADQILVIGDSVIWGHYVSRQNTLSHYLNEMAGSDRFTNLGLDGIHPAAMDGLLRYYAKDIADKKVILHLNPLWFSSPRHDLQTDKEFIFNHPELVAQFTLKIPCYKATFSKRLNAVLGRYIPLHNWVSHINITYFQSMDIPAWTIENPYKNPLAAVTLQLPLTDNFEQPDPAGRSDNRQVADGYQWVELQTSVQWQFFRRTIKLLRERGNKVFVLVGPFNEHRLEGTSLDAYGKLKKDIESWLQQNNIDYYMPPVLPVELYIDASHPDNEGYALLAQWLLENESFEKYLLK